jgi:hypothetical protein
MRKMSNLYNISNVEFFIIGQCADFKYNKLYQEYGLRVDSYVKVGNSAWRRSSYNTSENDKYPT